MPDLVTRAATFAKAAHESINQRRKYSGDPYIVHPQAVAGIVESVTDDQAMIAAAWLHDVVEDTPVTIEQIAERFGEDVAGLVADLTKVSKKSDGNRAARKAIDREHTAAASARAKTVKLADLVDNLGGLAEDDPEFAKVYFAEKELLMDVLTEGEPNLFGRVMEIIRQGKAVLIGSDV